MSISPRGIGGVIMLLLIMLLLIMHKVIRTDSVRGPFSATHISFSDQILVRKDGDTKTSVSGTTPVVHEKPTTPSPPSPPDSPPSPSPGLAIIARVVGFLNPPSEVKFHYRRLLMDRPPPPIKPTCHPRCK